MNSSAATLNLNCFAVAESLVAGFFSSAGAGADAGAAFFARYAWNVSGVRSWIHQSS